MMSVGTFHGFSLEIDTGTVVIMISNTGLVAFRTGVIPETFAEIHRPFVWIRLLRPHRIGRTVLAQQHGRPPVGVVMRLLALGRRWTALHG